VTGLVIFGLYLAGVAFTTVFVGRDIHAATQEKMGVPAAEQMRGPNIVLGFMIGLVWPVSLPLVAAYLALAMPVRALFRTRLDREHAARVELETLRKQAQELGLPYPGEDR